ncbi:MAG: hypothetical protein RR061_07550 [Muribaculaceae bacterium]
MKHYIIIGLTVALSAGLLCGAGCKSHKKVSNEREYELKSATDSVANGSMVSSMTEIDSSDVVEIKWDYYPATETLPSALKSVRATRLSRKRNNTYLSSEIAHVGVKRENNNKEVLSEKVDKKSNCFPVILILVGVLGLIFVFIGIRKKIKL